MASELFANATAPGTPLATTLAAGISSGATSLTVASSTGFPAAVSGVSQFRLLIDSEILVCSNVSGTAWSVDRGQEGTAAAAHLTGAAVTYVVTAGALANYGAAYATQAALASTSTSDRARANHTGTQSAATITGLATVATTGAYSDLTGIPASSGSGLPSTFVSKTAAYTAAAAEWVEANVSGGGFTITLPAAPAVGALVVVQKIDSSANTLTIAPSAAGTINGDATATTTAQWAGAVFEHKASNVWRIAASLSTSGPAGADGRTVLTTSGAPSSGVGVNGDFAYDPTAKIMYGPKAAGAWPSGVSLAGSNGTNGAGVPAGGTAGQILTKNTGTDYDSVWATSSASSPLKIRTGSGYWHGRGGSVASIGALGANYLRAMPMFFDRACTATSMAIYISTAVASSTVRLGIYADDGAGAPGTLVIDAGTVDSSTTGVKSPTTFSASLTTGLYWLVAVQQGGASPVSWNRDNADGMGGFIFASPVTNLAQYGSYNCYLLSTSTSGALPSTAPAAPSDRIEDRGPRLLVKVT